MLPMITKSEDANHLVDNENIAKAIVTWRFINHGPFTSIYDLNSVLDDVTGGATEPNGFQNAEGTFTTAMTKGGGTGGVSSSMGC